MRVLFIRLSPYMMFKAPHPQGVEVNPDITYSSSVLEKDGHEIFLIDTESVNYEYKKILHGIKVLNPDVVGIYTKTPTSELTITLSRNIKKMNKNIKIIAFGQHPSASPQTFLFKDSPIDVCVMGEAEYTIRELIKRFDSDGDICDVRGIAFFDGRYTKKTKPRNLIKNLDKLPLPKHEWFLNGKYLTFYPIKIFKKIKWGFIESSRGCPHRCIFCSPALRITFGKKYRTRSAKNVADEIEYLVSHGVNVIKFMDDEFILDKQRIEKLCDEIIRRKIKIKWIAQGRVDGPDMKTIKKMKIAGCSTLCFGVESGSNRILKLLKKNQNVEQIKKTFKLCKKEGILTAAYFLIGCPTETKKEILQTYKLCKKINPIMIQVAFFTPYPGSSCYENINSNEVLFDEISHYNAIGYNFSNVESKELLRMQKKIYIGWLLDIRFLFNYFRITAPLLLLNFKDYLNFYWKSLIFLFQK